MTHIMGKHWAEGHPTSETPCSQRCFSQGNTCPLHMGCAGTCNFPKCQELDFICCDNGRLCQCPPLQERRKIPCNDSCLTREVRLLADMEQAIFRCIVGESLRSPENIHWDYLYSPQSAPCPCPQHLHSVRYN